MRTNVGFQHTLGNENTKVLVRTHGDGFSTINLTSEGGITELTIFVDNEERERAAARLMALALAISRPKRPEGQDSFVDEPIP